MRIHFSLIPSKIPLLFDHQHLLVGTIHKWLGWNKEHGKLSLYSFSRLEGGRNTKNGLLFEKLPTFFFSSYNADLIRKLVNGVKEDRTMFEGFEVNEVVIQEDPDLLDREMFLPGSPILIKRFHEDRIEHIIYNDARAGECLREILLKKMKEAGLEDDNLEIRFDPNYHRAGTKLVNYKGVKNRASWCPVIIKGKPETKLFAWNVGLGNSTGTGFGAIK